jgi:site-specific DNA-cytosine methylase
VKVLELFGGTCSFSNVAKELGYETYTTDRVKFSRIDEVADIFDFNYKKFKGNVDIIWASPPCTYFSVSSIGHHWNHDNTPKTQEAIYGMEIVKKTVEIIEFIDPQYFFIENPRGKLRKLDLLQHLNRQTVTYCQYGDKRRKPTDIWTNLTWTPRPMCNNGDSCHVKAPRGSSTGTQGMNYLKAKVPYELCKELLLNIETVTSQ